MDAVKFMKAKDKMCYSYPCCFGCPLAVRKNKMGMTCSNYVNKYTEEAVTVVEKWLIDHPSKTIADDFLEKYPNAPLADDGNPQVCVKYLGCKTDCCNSTCTECWNRPIE